ncbi:putative angiopoietin-related protein 7-like [Apostichopus japonicus]|uniref:Putative angiopoietin-related protein 7-like n=1 Tax=Stichopus japonicus TaxID=307972 RepID=A0A2G8L0F3_STIJA|nr:putative angiopoietin-related protein 7-like [Apostichopus japonicus]
MLFKPIWLNTFIINALNIQRTAETSKVSALRPTLAEYTLLSQMDLKNHLRFTATTTLAEEAGRSWSQYQDGFGFLSTEFWLGNEKLSYLTNQADYELRVDIELSNGASFYTTYIGFRITDEWGQYMMTHIGEIESNADTLISTCPTNMIYGTYSCQETCEHPNGQPGCNSDPLGSEGCTCPAGFLMQGSDCISASECECFVTSANLVIPSGETYVNDDCTQNCSCNNNQLICKDYTCSTNAVCDVKNEVRQCYCNEGYEGDGETCESLYTDCQDVYDARHRQDGVYTIMPTGWPGLPFDVYCKMENGGGWTVFQRRTDGSTSFYQNWAAYKEGLVTAGTYG